MLMSCDPQVSLHSLLLMVKKKLVYVAGSRPWSLESAPAVLFLSSCLPFLFQRQGRQLLFVSESMTVRLALSLIKERMVRNVGPQVQKSLPCRKNSSKRQNPLVTDEL